MSDGPRGGLGRKAAVGFLASASSQAGRTGLQVASVVVLGRLLSPRDYGLMAMVMAVLGLADMLRDMGLSTVAIQAKTLTAAQRNNLWLINTMIGAGLMVLTILVSPLFAWGYGQPETAWIACAMAPNFLLSAMQTQYRAGFTRELRFTFISMVDFLSTLVGLLLGTFLALLGSGYWALVGQTLLTTVLALVAVAIKADWRPRGFIRMSGTMALIKKGLSFFASMVMSYVATNLDSVIIGRVAGADALGLYNRAAQLIRVPFRQIQSPAGAVMMPTMSRIQHDHVRLRRAMQLQQSAVSYPLAIVAVIVAAAPADLVRLALGEQWISAAPLMAVVAASAAIGSISTPVSTVLTAMGLSKELARLTAMTATLNIAAIIIGAQWGAIGVAAALGVSYLVMRPVPFWMLYRAVGFDARSVLLAGFRLLVGGGIVWVGVWSLMHAVPAWPSIVRLLTATGATLLGFAVLALIRPFRQDMLAVSRIIPTVLRRRRPGAGGTPVGEGTLATGDVLPPAEHSGKREDPPSVP